jgi:hypothetical protein
MPRKSPERRAKDADCNPEVLRANNPRFVKVAENLAANGVTEAQVALGRWYLLTAAFLAAQEPVGASRPGEQLLPSAIVVHEPANTGTGAPDDGMPAQEIAPVNPAFQTPEFQKVADLLAQAASKDTDAQALLSLLESVGVRPATASKQ